MKPEVVTIGLGYIGLPTSALIASHGTNVLGVDINQNIVDTINQGKILTKYAPNRRPGDPVRGQFSI